MDNNNMNEEDKYTNYTYQGGQQGNAEPGSYQAPSQEERMKMNGAANNIYQHNDPSYSGSSQNGYNNGYQQPNGQNGYNNGYQSNGYNNGYQQNGYNNGYNNGYQQPNGQNGSNNGYQQPNGQNGYNNGYQPNGYNNGYTQYNYNNAPVNNNDGTSTGALVCGIISIVLGCGGIGIVTGIIALVLSSKYKNAHNGEHNGQSKAGFICGLIGVILGALAIVYYIIIFVAAAGMAGASAVSYYNW